MALRTEDSLASGRESQHHFMPWAPGAVTSTRAIPYSWQVSRIGAGRLIGKAKRKRRTDMRKLTMLGVVCLTAISLAPAGRADDKCKDVSGHAFETTIPSGVGLGPATGDLKAVVSGQV